MRVNLYTRQSCLAVTARDLAVMGATLADGGVNPITGSGWSAPRPAVTAWRFLSARLGLNLFDSRPVATPPA